MIRFFLPLLTATIGVTLLSAQTVLISGTSAVLGMTQTLTCTLVDIEVTNLLYRWRIGENIIVEDFSSSNQFVIFTVGVSNARDYFCDVRTETGTIYTATASLNVAIRGFSVSFTRDNPTNPAIPYVGSNISYSCQTQISGNLLAGLTGRVEISDNSGTPILSTEDRVSVSETAQISNTFARTLYFSPLSAEDVGQYRCTGIIHPATPNPLIANGTGSAIQSITIIALQLAVELAPVTGHYLDIEPYNSLSLTCSATVMLRNDPAPLNIEFSWLRSVNSGPQEELTSDLYTNSRVFGSAETSILTVHTEQPGKHTYICRVNLDVSPAPDVIMDEDSVHVEVIGPANPHIIIPEDLTPSSTSTFADNMTVHIQWLVTSLSYGPESYRVLYGLPGAELDMESPVVTSGDDITVMNLTLSVQLTGLMSGTTYNYRLQVNNSVGSVLSSEHSFITTNQPEQTSQTIMDIWTTNLNADSSTTEMLSPTSAPAALSVVIIAAVSASALSIVFVLVVIIVILLIRSRKSRKLDLKIDQRLDLDSEGTNLNANISRKIDPETSYIEAPLSIQVANNSQVDIPKHFIIDSCNLQLGESVGQGEYGIVYKAKLIQGVTKSFNQVVAVKTLKGFLDQRLVKDLLQECTKMSTFDHPNVLTLIGVCVDGGPAPYIVMPFMFNGSLLKYLKKERDKLLLHQNLMNNDFFEVSAKLVSMCLQVAKGMEYLAKRKVVHRDLAARNCMIDLNFVIKVADFGLSETIDPNKDYFRQENAGIDGVKLPVKWLAPECLVDGIFSEKSDVWAFGVTCWEVFSGGKIPYSGVNSADLPHMLENGYRMERPNNFACGDSLFAFMTNCWEGKAAKRPTFSEIVKALSLHLECLSGYTQLRS